ncbi:hypothetical protein Csa_020731 [Cucumis sativus]|uniref:Putative plant transposon protein domain-containing protein n=1 Tax=Cucumis sativus TaxID=3659 RepID=A0A0A0KER1_CUCSA|nr:hypothetical protein Csa_020731 [Cucumis sativus]
MMSSKTKRARSALSSEGAFNRHKFISKDAADRYRKLVVKSSVIPERGLAPCEVHQPQLFQNIMQRGWSDFVKQPEPAVLSIVREFYANMVEGSSRSFVRGRQVSFDYGTINRYYHLPNFERDEYDIYASEHVDVHQIIRELCQPGAEWVINPGEPIRFKSSNLTVSNQVWHKFICAKLLPVAHTSSVTKERAILLYAIATKRSVDVGKVIQKSLCNIRKSGMTGGLGHSSLITALCRNEGVVWNEKEELVDPKPIMDKSFIMEIPGWSFEPMGAGHCDETAGTSHCNKTTDAGHNDEPSDQDEAEPIREVRQTLTIDLPRQTQRPLSLDEQIRRLERRVRSYHRRSEERFDHLYKCLFALHDRGVMHVFPPRMQPYVSSDDDS